ncbi:MAG: 50S ribosome-binding GTPase [Candidatus Helarchaeota archaeon]|nr:50S ribosome-binding GTPase [Candidatus Helarchaeota archaeon]
MSEPDTVHKILLVGLDQAGKTSILNVLNEKYNQMDNIKPTVGIERDEIKILGIPIRTWDLGGQEKFRKDYLKLKNVRIFDQADSIFFVIDVWNATRFEEALNYYSQIMEIYEKLGQRPKIEILLHKVDPNLRHNPNTDEILKNLKNLFQEESVTYEISLYATSIFDRKSIIEAFSKNLQDLIVTLQPFKKLLESVALLQKLDAAILFDENLMILSDYYRNKVIEEMCLDTVYNSVHYLTYTNPKLAETDKFTTNFELVLNVKNTLKKFTFMDAKYRGWNVYLLTMSDKTAEVDPDAISAKFKTVAHIFEKKEKAQ